MFNVPKDKIGLAVWPDGSCYDVEESGFEQFCSNMSDDYAVLMIPIEVDGDQYDDIADEFANKGTWLHLVNKELGSNL